MRAGPFTGRAGAPVAALAVLLGVLAAPGAAPAAAATARVVLAGSAPVLPAGSAVTGQVAPTTSMGAQVALKVPDPAALSAAAAAVATPGSPGYHHFLAPGQFAALYGPSAASIDAVRSWLASQGLDVGATSPDGLFISVQGTAQALEGAFGTPLESVRLADGTPATTTAAAPSVASSLASLVSGVTGLDTTARSRSQLLTTPTTGPTGSPTSGPNGAPGGAPTSAVTPAVGGPGNCPNAQGLARPGGAVTAGQLASAYGLTSLYAAGDTGAGVGVGIVEFEGFNPSDITAYEACYGLPEIQPQVVGVDGGPSLAPSEESALDVEAVAALAPASSITVFEAPNSGSGPQDVFDQISNTPSIKVVSTSWGTCEQQLGSAAASAENIVFEKMALQGQTVVAASGDSGSSDCYGPGSTDTELAVDDPGSQPAVLSAGGTSLPSTGYPTGETVWNGGGGAGGGGSSVIWPRLAYQPDLAQGREVPDVAADADPGTGYPIDFNGAWVQVGGTSLAAPTWAALLALLVQAKGGAGLGDVKPALYAMGCNPAAFTDVTASVRGASDNALFDSSFGLYPANPGYDQASGWGSPRAAGLNAYWGQPYSCADLPPAQGYRMVATDGGIFSFNSPYYGSMGGRPLNQPVVGIASDPSTGGYWEVASDGGIFAFNAPFYGSMGGRPLNQPIVGMTAAPGGSGYWLVAADGGIFAFGPGAGFYGSTGSLHLNRPVVGMTAAAGGNGYWLVASDGGIFAFGVPFLGSMGGRPLAAPVVGMSAGGGGYRLVASDGGIFSFGAPFYGAPAGSGVAAPVVGMASDPVTGGYWISTSSGQLYAYDAPTLGSLTSLALNRPVVAVASR